MTVEVEYVVMRMETSLKYLVLLWTLLFVNAKGAELITCLRDYDKVGCYDEYNPGITDLVVYDRFGIQWGKIEAYMHNLACRCEAKVRRLNKDRGSTDKYVGFALHFWGECYGRTLAQMNALTSRSNSKRCTGDQTYTSCYQKNPECTGHAFSEFVYRLRPLSGETGHMTICSKKPFNITCGAQLGISSIKASFGRRTETFCGAPLTTGWKPECGTVSTRLQSSIRTFCNGRSICKFDDIPNDPHDICPSVSKYFALEYVCLPKD